MESPPELTVVVPTHDVKLWVDDCLTSIRSQEGVSLRIVVIDDHSTDGTLEIVGRHAAEDRRLTVIEAESSGGGSARNLGASLVETEYLAFADGDDLVPPGAYAALVGSLTRTHSDMAVADFYKFSAHQSWRPSLRWNAFTTYRAGITLADHPPLIRNRACWNRVFRTEFWTSANIVFPDVPRSNDIVPMTTALVSAQAIDVLPDVVYLYRERPGSGSMTAAAGATTSLRSYLAQEVHCDRILESADPLVRREYDRLVFDADGWVHLRRALSAAVVWADDDAIAIAASVAELLERADSGHVARLPPLRRLVMELVARRRPRDAARLLQIAEDGWEQSTIADVMAFVADQIVDLVIVGDARSAAFAELVLDPLLAVARTVDGTDLATALEGAAEAFEPELRAWVESPQSEPNRSRTAAAVLSGDTERLRSLSSILSQTLSLDYLVAGSRGLVVGGVTSLASEASPLPLVARRMKTRGYASIGNAALASSEGVTRWSAEIPVRGLGDGNWQLFAVVAEDSVGTIEIPVTSARDAPALPDSRWARVVSLPRKAQERIVLADRGGAVTRGLRRVRRLAVRR